MSTNYQSTTATTHASLTHDLQSRYHLPVLSTWLTNFLTTTRQPYPPLPALCSTAHFRILASDITTSLSISSLNQLLPHDINDINVKERRLNGDVVVQVLEVTDIGKSKWSQVEAIERIERGEEVRGREVIRNIPGVVDEDGTDDGGGGTTNANRAAGGGGAAGSATNGAGSVGGKRSQGPHTLVLQDAKGVNATGLEMGPVPKCWIGDDGMNIGCKIVLKSGTLIRRGMIMLRPEDVHVLGGKIESWDAKWREGRKGRLVRAVDELPEG